ncbi:hypothetical protein EYF80_049518 [Liparis tanakae]|uniref:Uncharacterized protein n=1 Tax=Liparis tanakae TaxID=230148 RepID=A0A4Z2FJ68_9TELE|nr:hypothetical protein EYF80_049518 [Liparis tanakae]
MEGRALSLNTSPSPWRRRIEPTGTLPTSGKRNKAKTHEDEGRGRHSGTSESAVKCSVAFIHDEHFDNFNAMMPKTSYFKIHGGSNEGVEARLFLAVSELSDTSPPCPVGFWLFVGNAAHADKRSGPRA